MAVNCYCCSVTKSCLTFHKPRDGSTPGLPVVVKVIKGELFFKKLITFTITHYFTISSVLSFLKVDISIDIICIPPKEIVLAFIVVHSGLLVIKFFSFLLSGNIIILHSFLKDIFLLNIGFWIDSLSFSLALKVLFLLTLCLMKRQQCFEPLYVVSLFLWF